MTQGMDDACRRVPFSRYPSRLVIPAQSADGIPLVVRSITEADAPLLAAFHAKLSDQTVRRRYFRPVDLEDRTAEDSLIRECHPDPDGEAELLVVHADPANSEEEAVAVGRLERVDDTTTELAILVSDGWQHHGIGAILLDLLVAMARARGVERLVAYILRENEPMQHLCRGRGFEVHPTTVGLVRAELPLLPAA